MKYLFIEPNKKQKIKNQIKILILLYLIFIISIEIKNSDILTNIKTNSKKIKRVGVVN